MSDPLNHVQQRYKELEAKINHVSAKKDMLLEADSLLKKELAQLQNEIDELVKELLITIDELRKS